VGDASRYCEGPGPDGNTCGRPAFRGVMDDRPLCEAHQKQLQRGGRLTPIAPSLTPEARTLDALEAFVEERQRSGRHIDPRSLEGKALAAGEAWVEASSLDDAEYETRRRAALNAMTALGRKRSVEEIREGLRRAKRNGVKLGRPPKVTPHDIARQLRRTKKVADVAKALGVSERTVQRHKRRRGKK
jgi:DNA-binding NarL/FixJ family response regulator